MAEARDKASVVLLCKDKDHSVESRHFLSSLEQAERKRQKESLDHLVALQIG